MIQVHATSLNIGDVVVGYVQKTRKGWKRSEFEEIELLPNADLAHFASYGEKRQWLVLDGVETTARGSRPSPIHRSRLWLHMDPTLHPETDYVIDLGKLYRNVGTSNKQKWEFVP